MPKNPSARLIPTFLLAASVLGAAGVPQKRPDGIVVPIDDALLKVEIRADNIIRVAFARNRTFFRRASLAVEPGREPVPPWELTTDAGTATLATAKLKVRVDLATGAVSFLDPAGRVIVAERPGGREITAATVPGAPTAHVRQAWEPADDEALYGLGENQLGLFNLKGYDLDLWQHNGTAAVPFLVSSRGYGIFWDNPSYTRFGDVRPFEAIPAAQLLDADGRAGGLTGT